MTVTTSPAASPLSALQDPTLLKTQALIDGQWVDAADRSQRFDVTDPATGAHLASVPNLGAAETETAIAAANRAWGPWAKLPAKARSAILMKWFHLLHQHAEDLARIMTAEQGKPLAEAKGEVGYGASFLEWFAEESKRIYGETVQEFVPDKRILVLKQPIGVAAAITPWNFPIAMLARKLAAALAAGCTFIAKPAPETPLSALLLGELCQEAGLPAGVVNIITGVAAMIGEVIMASPIVRKVSFTGLGLNWDEGAWLVNAEYTMRRTETYVADTDAWYVTVGRRFGNWTPYATASQIRTVDSNVTNTVLPLNAQLAQLKAMSPNEFKQVEIVESQVTDNNASVVILMTTRNNPGPDEDAVQVSGKLQLRYERSGGRWNLKAIENLSFRYTIGLAT